MIHTDFNQQSWLEFRKQELVLHLGTRLFPPDLWHYLRDWFSGDWQTSWLTQPFQRMMVEEDQPGWPRWKQFPMDMFSTLIFRLTVPYDHPLVQLWQRLDWAALNRLGAPCYANHLAGQRAWAPAQMIALLLLFVVLPASSETALLRQVSVAPLYRWFCGFGLFSPLPDHSSLYTFRKRLGVERFEAMLTWVVLQCQQAGLVSNELLFYDMTGVEASAHRFSPYERAVLLTQALIHYLERSGAQKDEVLTDSLRLVLAQVALEAQDNEGLRQQPHLAPRLLRSLERWTTKAGQPLWQRAIEEVISLVLAEQGSQFIPPPADSPAGLAWLKGLASRLKVGLPHARGDLQARVGWTSNVTLLCGYWLGFLLDSLQQVITAVRLMPLNQTQHEQLIPALEQHRQRLGSYPSAVVTDSAQDVDHVHLGLAQRQIQGQIASRQHQGRGGGWGPSHFHFNPAGQLVCPHDEILSVGSVRRDGLVPYQAKGCPTCPLKVQCLPKGQQPDGPRRVHLAPQAHQRWLQNRENTRTLAYKVAQSQRFASEGLFGLAERLHRAKHAAYRSTDMNLVQGLLVGIALNLNLLNCQAAITDP